MYPGTPACFCFLFNTTKIAPDQISRWDRKSDTIVVALCPFGVSLLSDQLSQEVSTSKFLFKATTPDPNFIRAIFMKGYGRTG